MDHTFRSLARKFGARIGKVYFGYDNASKENYAIAEADLREDLLTGWRDLRAPLVSARVPATGNPTLAAFGPSGGLFQHLFLVNDQVYLSFHIDHDIKPGSTIFPHVHWATDGTSTNTVKWEFEFTTAKRTDAEAFPAPTIITVEEASSNVAWAHQVTEHGTGFTAPEVDSLVIAKLKRITNGGSENDDDIFGLFCDLHSEADRYGTVSRSPDYYTEP